MLLLKLLCAVAFFSIHNVALPQPPGKHWEAVAYNQNTNELAVFSGVEFKDNKMLVTDSLWLFKNNWRCIDGINITGRWAHALVYHNNLLFTYGGLRLNGQQQEEVLNDLQMFNGSWSKVAEGPKLSSPTLHSSKGKLFLAGQSVDDKRNFEVWEIVNNNFQKQSSTKPGPGSEGFRTLFVENCFVLIYPSDSGFVFQNITTGIITVVNRLPKRTKFGITYNAHLGSYFLFGGLDEQRNFSNGLWQITDGRAKELILPNCPSQRASCSLLPTAGGFILYGGSEDGGRLSNALWHYEKGKWMSAKY